MKWFVAFIQVGSVFGAIELLEIPKDLEWWQGIGAAALIFLAARIEDYA